MEARIRAIYDEHQGRYGYRRITAALSSSLEVPINHKCVQRLMQVMGLRALIRAKKRSRHVPGVSDEHVPNVLQRDFCATAPNQKWTTDVTEFNVNGHKLYLSACMDLYNGEIIAHRMARRPVFELVSGTLKAALSRIRSAAELIVHSDQGWHYKMQPYRAMLARRGVKQSMSRKGNCFDNAAIESFFGTLKAEYFRLAAPTSIDALEEGCMITSTTTTTSASSSGCRDSVRWSIGREAPPDRRHCDRPTSGGQFKPGAIQRAMMSQTRAERKRIENSCSASMPLASARWHQAIRSATSCSRDCEVLSHI